MSENTFTPGINYDHADGEPRDTGGTVMTKDPISGRLVTGLQAHRSQQMLQHLRRCGTSRRSCRTKGRRLDDE